jgi:hypothetical protein
MTSKVRTINQYSAFSGPSPLHEATIPTLRITEANKMHYFSTLFWYTLPIRWNKSSIQTTTTTPYKRDIYYKTGESKTCNRKCKYKERAIVIINSNEYSKKVHTFLAHNCRLLQKDPTDKYQKLTQKTLQQCNLIIDKHKIKYLNQKKPSPPTMKAQLRLHKHNIPIRPVINNMNAPTYKIAKHLVGILNKHLTLNNNYNVKNCTAVATELTNFNLNENHKLITYDIKDLYVNIPTDYTLTITKSMLLKSNDTQHNRYYLNDPHSITKLFHFPKQDLPARKSSIHWFTNRKYNSRNISTASGRHAYKTTSWHKKTQHFTRDT